MKKLILSLLISICCAQLFAANAENWTLVDGTADKARLIIMADMGNEPDEQQQMMHLLLYSSEVDLEGLIAVTGKFLGPHMRSEERQVLYPQLFHDLINGYSKVYKNLLKHNPEYPDPKNLHSVVASGQTGYGSESIGLDKSSEGAKLFLKAFEKEDPRPLVIIVNAGSNTLAQALLEYEQNHSKKEIKELVSRLRVVENGAQDDSGAYICNKYPEIYWVRSNYQAYCYGGPLGNSRINDGTDNHKNHLGPYTWQPYAYSGLGQHQWMLEHIIGNHSIFGSYYPLRKFGNGSIGFVEGGGTVPWLCTINRGLSDINNFQWGGWSGRYSTEKQENYMSKHESVRKDEVRYQPFSMFSEGKDKWIDPETDELYENIYVPVWRWRRAFFNDFKYRMDWCLRDFSKANHNPTIVVDGIENKGILMRTVKAGTTLEIDGSASYDVDKNKLYFRWFNYSEAGDYPSEVKIQNSDTPKVSISIPKDAKGHQLHIILELRDNKFSEASYSYKRMIINCK